MTGKPTIIAAAQICAKDENIEYNLSTHYGLIRLAVENGVQLLVFPEMSITGYVREAASRLAFTQYDARLNELRNLAEAYHMIIIAGAPVRLGSALHVGSFVIFPDHSVSLYTKQYLYEGESDYFTPSSVNNPLLTLDQENISLAICYDMENIQHIMKAIGAGSTVYSASIFYSDDSIGAAHELLSTYARAYSINVLMANYTGHLCHIPAGGSSAFWSSSGERLACLEASKTGLVIGLKENGNWTGETVYEDNYNLFLLL
jgi:predicted amidohydrolase